MKIDQKIFFKHTKMNGKTLSQVIKIEKEMTYEKGALIIDGKPLFQFSGSENSSITLKNYADLKRNSPSDSIIVESSKYNANSFSFKMEYTVDLINEIGWIIEKKVGTALDDYFDDQPQISITLDCKSLLEEARISLKKKGCFF